MKRTYKKKKNKIHYILLVLVFMIIGRWMVGVTIRKFSGSKKIL